MVAKPATVINATIVRATNRRLQLWLRRIAVFGSGSGVATVPMPARSFSNHTERLITVIKTQKAKANNTLSIERRSKVERRQWYSSGEKPAKLWLPNQLLL
jgi:hypothetical protein